MKREFTKEPISQENNSVRHSGLINTNYFRMKTKRLSYSR